MNLFRLFLGFLHFTLGFAVAAAAMNAVAYGFICIFLGREQVEGGPEFSSFGPAVASVLLLSTLNCLFALPAGIATGFWFAARRDAKFYPEPAAAVTPLPNPPTS